MRKNYDKDSIRTTLSENVKRLREKAGLSQAELAEQANRTQNFIGYIENKKCGISDETLALLANALGAELVQFYTTASSLSNPQDEILSEYLDEYIKGLGKFLNKYRTQIIKEEVEKSRKAKNK